MKTRFYGSFAPRLIRTSLYVTKQHFRPLKPNKRNNGATFMVTASFLLGKSAIPVISELSATLKAKTIRRASELDGVSYEGYTPWLSLRPRLSRPIEDQRLLENSYVAGDLILDREYLEALSRFTTAQGEPIMRGLPGTSEDWKILTEPEKFKPNIGQSFRSARLIMDRSSFFREVYLPLVDMVIPLVRERSCGFSSLLARGAIFRSFHTPHTGATVALDLAHEMGHQALILLQSVDPLISSDLNAPVFSEIRRRDRPAIQSLHAAAALAYMLILSRGMNTNREELDAVQQRSVEYGGNLADSVAKATRSLTQKCKFTQVGSRVIEEFERLVA